MQRTHFGQHGPNCFGCKIQSVSFGVAAFPTRKPDAVKHAEWVDQMETDMPAYKALRADGLQPPAIAGSRDRMMHAETAAEVEGRPELSDRTDEFLTGEVPDMAGAA